MLIGAGIAVLTSVAQIYSEYMRKHPAYAWVAGIIATLMILIPLAHTALLWFRRKEGVSALSPLEIIFEPLNPARRFWELLAPLDDYKRVTPAYWEHRVEIRNNSPITLRNVVVTFQHDGAQPRAPQRALFARTKTESCDLNPGCSEMVIVSHLWHPKYGRIGQLSGPSGWGHGPIIVIASADNTAPAEKVFDANPETDQLLFERGKY